MLDESDAAPIVVYEAALERAAEEATSVRRRP